MLVATIVFSIVTVCVPKSFAVESDGTTFRAVVVEYAPPIDPTLDPYTNILNNVDNYVDFITLANSKFLVDIIVFPEVGLKGYFNQYVFLEIPDPQELVKPCAHDTKYEAPLVQLSCSARSAATYVVVNLQEKFFNVSDQSTMYFNTDVVFDRDGTVVARYRKIHLYGESTLGQPKNKELVYFDTDFGVRFGLLTCFDIIFEDPGVVLANEYNITHFIFPTAWFSEMPFLTAIQEQYYWAYTLDVVLLASGYNMPSSGSSGTGIYLGRQGPVVYNMTEIAGSFMLHAELPKRRSDGFKQSSRTFGQIDVEKHTSSKWFEAYPSVLNLKRDFLDVYATELITIPDDAQRILNGSDVIIPFMVDRTICHNSLCCNFSLEITSVFSKSKENQTSRNDDYSEFYYRMSVFDGVRHYDHMDTGGLQTCAIIPCVNVDLASCGLVPQDSDSKPNTLLELKQTKFIFQSIKIIGNFSNNNSFIGPNVLIGGEYSNFGALLDPKDFNFSETNNTGTTVVKIFQTTRPITNLVTSSLYARLFLRDGLDYTGDVVHKVSSGSNLCCIVTLMIVSLIFIKYKN